MALFAADQGIMTGEELTYDYNFDPYSQKNVQVCRCGADNCRGVLGPKPKELPKKEKESTLAGAKRKIAEVLEEGKEMVTGNKKRKTDERKKLPKGWVYLAPDEKPKASTSKKEKKSADEIESKGKGIDGSLSRHPSKLRRIVSTKSKSVRSIKSVSNTGSKKKRQGQRVASTNSTSSGTALITTETASDEQEEWEDAPEEPVRPISTGSSRSKSSIATLKAKAGSIKGKVGRSLRGK